MSNTYLCEINFISLYILPLQSSAKDLKIQHYQFLCWKNANSVPENLQTFMRLITAVNKHSEPDNGKQLFHCLYVMRFLNHVILNQMMKMNHTQPMRQYCKFHLIGHGRVSAKYSWLWVESDSILQCKDWYPSQKIVCI